MELRFRKHVHGNATVARLEIVADDEDDRAAMAEFIDALNERVLDPAQPNNPVFDVSIRIESVGLTSDNEVDTIIFENRKP